MEEVSGGWKRGAPLPRTIGIQDSRFKIQNSRFRKGDSESCGADMKPES
jgi:hypothetical protein